MRDALKSKEYFDKYIELSIEDLDFYVTALETSKGFNRDYGLLHQLVLSNYDILEAQYSKGDDIAVLAKSYSAALAALPALQEKRAENPDYVFEQYQGYVGRMKHLSFAVLFQPKGQDLANVLDEVVFLERSDVILDTMLQHLGQELPWPVHTTNQWPEMRSLANAIAWEPEARQVALMKYLKEWYANNKDAAWYDNHKNKNDIYNGYWCWEAAAVAVMLDIDDTPFRDHEHYPADLADWARVNKRK